MSIDRGKEYRRGSLTSAGTGGAAIMNIQALLGTRPETEAPRRTVVGEKGRDRERVPVADGAPRDIVELSVEGKQRAAADSQDSS
jgi:hypothetical protein